MMDLGRYLVHTDQKKWEMLSAGKRTGRCFTWTGFIWNQSAALQLELSLAFSTFILGNTVCMGTHYQLHLCQQCFSLPGMHCSLCPGFQYFPCYLPSTLALLNAGVILRNGQFSRFWLGKVNCAALCMQKGLKCALLHHFVRLDIF